MRANSTGSLLDMGASQDPAVVWGEVSLNRGEVRKLRDVLASRLKLRAGQRAVIIAPNLPALVVGMFAAWRAGAVAVPLNTRLRRYDLARVLADAEPTAIVSITEHGGFPVADVVHALAPSIETLKVQIVTDELGQVVSETSFSHRAEAESLDTQAATVLYTSGSTGDPKGGVLAHDYGLQIAASFQTILGPYAESPAAYVVPISNGFGYATLLASIRAGAPALLVDTAATLAVAATIHKHGAGVVSGSPALFATLLRSHATVPIRAGFVAGARCPPELIAEWEKHGTLLLNHYGMTELGGVTACHLDDTPEVRYNTVGRALPGYEVRAAEAPAHGIPTEILVRGIHVWPSLFGRPWEPSQIADDSWIRTGDLGFVDQDGNVTIAGRAKDVVQVGGFNVLPAEVESFLLTHPGVAAAAVLGVPNRLLGEALVAFVVPRSENRPTPRELTGFCRAGIAGYKVPTAFHLLDTLPLLSSGKVDRRALAATVGNDSR